MVSLRFFRNICIFLCILFLGLGHLASQDVTEAQELATGVWYGQVTPRGDDLPVGAIAFVVDNTGTVVQGGVRLANLADENVPGEAEACVTHFADLTTESRPAQLTGASEETVEGLLEVASCFVAGEGYVALSEPWTGAWEATLAPTTETVDAVRLFAGQPTEAVASGEALFNLRCSACHGVGGVGTEIAPPLVDFPVLPHDYIESRVRSGPDVMSAFDEGVLPNDQLADIVAYIQSDLVGTQIREYSEAELAEGRDLYIEKCAECHGTRGQGTNDYGPPLLIWPPYSVTGIYEGARMPLPEMPIVRVSSDELDLIAGYYVLEMNADE